MNDEAALLKAIVAHSGEDTPRLAYADWLEEHGDPDRAAFIRVQCRYTAASPTQGEYPDLQEEMWFCRARCARQLRDERPAVPAGLDYAPALNDETYRRGFFHGVRGSWHAEGRQPTDDEVDQVCRGLGPLTATTTVRKLVLSRVVPEQLARVLAAPGAEKLEGLVLGPSRWGDGDETARVLASADAVRGLQQLELHFLVGESGARALARCKFDRLEYFDLPGVDCEPDALAELTGADWFRSLMQIRCHGSARRLLAPILAALARLPRLEHLTLDVAHPPDAGTFPGPDGFRELAQLFLTGEFATRTTNWLARARMPKLIELRVVGLRNNGLRALRAAPWFNQLWILLLNRSGLNDRSVVALTRSALPDLRILELGDSPFGRDGLLALADGARLPALTTLDLNSTIDRTVPAPDVAAFAAALARPRLRNLWLAHWPLGPDGAKALAANPALTSLTSLSVSNCGIGDAGLNAIARSPHLQGLVELDASGNELRKPAALLDPEFLPRLSRCWLRKNPFGDTTAAKLAQSRDWYVELTDE